jgi:hypothetical protein
MAFGNNLLPNPRFDLQVSPVERRRFEANPSVHGTYLLGNNLSANSDLKLA